MPIILALELTMLGQAPRGYLGLGFCFFASIFRLVSARFGFFSLQKLIFFIIIWKQLANNTKSNKNISKSKVNKTFLRCFSFLFQFFFPLLSFLFTRIHINISVHLSLLLFTVFSWKERFVDDKDDLKLSFSSQDDFLEIKEGK